MWHILAYADSSVIEKVLATELLIYICNQQWIKVSRKTFSNIQGFSSKLCMIFFNALHTYVRANGDWGLEIINEKKT
jgi:hypothetical protein